jgi:hypothetical protein
MGVTDMGVTDMGVTDMGVTDMGVTDRGVTDRGVTDTGTVGGTDRPLNRGGTSAVAVAGPPWVLPSLSTHPATGGGSHRERPGDPVA